MTVSNPRTRAFGTDAATVTSGFLIDDDGFSWDEAQIVQIDNVPHQQAFDTDRFYKIPLSAARPVEQEYHTADGETVTMMKPAEELRDTAWSMDNAPITLDHPPSRIVDSVDRVHGFVRNPRWEEESERLAADAYVPVTDTEARAWVDAHDGVSIGFWYESDTDVDANGIDAYQRDLLIDHVAIVDEGRCSREQGCGLAADANDATAVRGFDIDLGDGSCSDGPCSCGLHLASDQYDHHHYDDKSQAREAAERIGCEGAHQHDDGTWMPCDSHTEFEELAEEMEMDNGGYSNGDVDPTNGVLRVSDQTIDDDTLTVDYVEWHEFPFTIEVHGWDSDETENYYGWQECPPGAHEDVTVPLTNQLPVGKHTLNLNIHEQSEIEKAGASVGSHDPDENPTADVIDVRVSAEHVAADSGVSYSEGDWVRWNYGDGTAVGRVTNVTTDGELSVEGGTREGTEDNPAYELEHWDDGEFGNNVVKRESEIRAADPPSDFGADALERILLDDSPSASMDELDEVYSDWDDVTNMSAAELRRWSRNPCSRQASDQPTSVIRRNLRLLETNKSDWETADIRDAKRTISFVERMSSDENRPDSPSDGTHGCPSDWATSLLNWAHNPFESLPDGPDDNADIESVEEITVDASTDVASTHNQLFDGDGAYDSSHTFLNDSRTVAGVTFIGLRDGDLDEASIPTDDFESHYLYPADTKSESSYPVVDGDGYLRRGNVEAAHSLGARGGVDADEHESNLESLNGVFEDSTEYSAPIDPDAFASDAALDGHGTTITISNNTIMTDGNDNGGAGPITVSDLAVDAIVDEHDGVAELKEQADEADELEAQLDAAKEEIDGLKEELESYRADEKRDVVEEITALTDTWDEDELMELEMDALESRLDLAEDIAADVSGSVETDTGVETDSGSSGSEYKRGEVYDLSETA